MRRVWLLCITMVFWFAASPGCGRAQGQKVATTLPADGSINLLAMGDWGDDGPAQHQVARTMADYVASKKILFQGMLLLGDNFRGNLDGVDDPAWQDVFEKMYDRNALDMPFFVSLGNHDYEGVKAQIEADYARLHPDSRWKFPARWYRVDIPVATPAVVALMLDSNMDNLDAADWLRQIDWLDKQLASIPKGCWTIVCAHHPLFSNGLHGDNGVLQTQWGALFKKYNLSFYVCGHDHDLQHLEIPDWRTSFVLAGGGGAGTRTMRNDTRGPFSRAVHGFAHFQFKGDLATVSMVGEDGNILHAFTRTRDGVVKTVETTGSDRATSKPLKAIQGLEEKAN